MVPCCWRRSVGPSKVLALTPPKQMMSFGCTRSICCCNQRLLHVASSSGRGWRFCGGRHFTHEVMKKSVRARPMVESMSVRNLPERPMKGRPVRSSSLPGASPMNMARAGAGPSPGTALCRLRASGHAVQRRMPSYRSWIVAMTSGNPLLSLFRYLWFFGACGGICFSLGDAVVEAFGVVEAAEFGA